MEEGLVRFGLVRIVVGWVRTEELVILGGVGVTCLLDEGTCMLEGAMCLLDEGVTCRLDEGVTCLLDDGACMLVGTAEWEDGCTTGATAAALLDGQIVTVTVTVTVVLASAAEVV